MKRYEIKEKEESSDGIWRGYGNPVFQGSKEGMQNFLDSHRGPLEIEEVTYKKGREIKRKIVGE